MTTLKAVAAPGLAVLSECVARQRRRFARRMSAASGSVRASSPSTYTPDGHACRSGPATGTHPNTLHSHVLCTDCVYHHDTAQHTDLVLPWEAEERDQIFRVGIEADASVNTPTSVLLSTTTLTEAEHPLDYLFQ